MDLTEMDSEGVQLDMAGSYLVQRQTFVMVLLHRMVLLECVPLLLLLHLRELFPLGPGMQ